MNIILAEESELKGGSILRLADRRACHISGVLHAAVGDELRIGIVNGPKGTGRVLNVTSDTVDLECRLESVRPPAPMVDIIVALPRPKVLKRLWAPLASMGVRRIFITNAEKVERNYFATHWLKPASYRNLLLEGLEQAGDTLLPEVRIVRRLKPFIEDECSTFAGRKLIAHPGAPVAPPKPPLGATSEILLAVGPEGGWTDFELNMLSHAGFAPISLGTRKLRTDTACIALLATIAALRG